LQKSSIGSDQAQQQHPIWILLWVAEYNIGLFR
jgi:hypothetical protein